MHHLHTITDALQWLRAKSAINLIADNRAVDVGDAFIAWPGAAVDGRHFVGDALQRGAVAALVEAQGAEAHGFDDPRIAALPGLRAQTGDLAAQFYDMPSETVRVIAITGTNGKTSTAWWLTHAWAAAFGTGTCGMVGTLGLGVPGALAVTGMTTPDPVLLQATLAHWRSRGVQACALEASSIGIAEQRLAGLYVDTAVFTNFTQDHLDYHGDMDAYWQAKRDLFNWAGLKHVVINVDDPKGQLLKEELSNRSLHVWTIGIESPAVLCARGIHHTARDLAFDIVEGVERVSLSTPWVGEYNVLNLLGVVAVLRAHGVSLEQAVMACSNLPAVPGRMESVKLQTELPASALNSKAYPMVVVDYAHTPDALAKAIAALRPVSEVRRGRLICVFGCGGDRDPVKRPLMGAASQAADCVWLTSDNPRTEDPESIIAQVRAGMTNAGQTLNVVVARADAIAQAIAQARPADVVLIAGKGHEDYQDVQGVKQQFSDQAHARSALNQYGEARA